MTLRKRLLGVLLSVLVLALGGLGVTATPASAIQQGASKICESYWAYTYIKAKDIVSGASNNLTNYPMTDSRGEIGECSGYHTSSNWRVDTDPMGASHSYRTRYDFYIGGGWELGSWNGCHTNSDNHSSNPADNTGSNAMRVVYENYDHGDCTNY